MFSNKFIVFKLMLIALVFTSFVAVRAVYVPTNRDTKEPPETVTYDITEPTEMQLLYETDTFKYFFRESRDTIAIYDKRNNYTWKTGTDLEFAKDIDDQCDDIIDLYEAQFIDLPISTFGDFSSAVTSENNNISVFNGEMMIQITNLDDSLSESDVLVQYDTLSLEQNQTYRLSVDMYAYQERTVKIVVGSDVAEVLTISTTKETYHIDFTMTSANNNNIPLQFLLGNIAGDVTTTSVLLDNIKLEKTDGTDVIDGTNQITRGDFELDPSELTTTSTEVEAACRDKEVRLNTTYTGFANSLVTVEYFDDSFNIKRVSSASYEDVDSQLFTVNGDASHYRLDIEFDEIDLEISVHIYFDDSGVRYEIRDEEITGEGQHVMASIIIAPFLGASGGAYEEFDINEMDYKDEEIFKYAVPGYALVPDGSGALIRFEDNDVKLNTYEGDIYGANITQNRLHYNFASDYVEFKQPTMPVFGIAHGNEQAAFVAYATSGDEYMQIISMPEENLTYYNFTYPRFEYNMQYLQVYNKSGWGYLTLYDDRNHFDIDMRYDFLSGDGSTGPSADYVGMAEQYRNYLVEQGQLHLLDVDYTDIPLHIDFLMSDVEEGVTGFTNMVTTDVGGVDRILEQLIASGITNVNAGLLGWNDGGLTIGDPRDTDFTREIGRKSEFEELIRSYQELGIDISFQDDYFTINEEMMNLRRNAAKHTNSWYSWVDTYEIPVEMYYFARPVKSIEWLHDQVKTFDTLGVSSYSIAGITNNLISDYTDDTMRSEAKQLLIDGFAQLDSEKWVNAYEPNSYLWPYVERYINAPVYGTQYLIETDTVPFLQLVLHGTMELYGPYSNFSFYTDSDVLRMIDYNIYPNFVLTDQPAYLLTDTVSRSFYSTQYELYQELVNSVYGRVNTALRTVIGAEWVDRTVVENGLIVNTYSNGVEIVINYTNDIHMYNGVVISPVSYEVVGD